MTLFAGLRAEVRRRRRRGRAVRPPPGSARTPRSSAPPSPPDRRPVAPPQPEGARRCTGILAKGLHAVHARPYSDPVDYSVLGPLRVESSRGPVEIRGAKERLLLARLVAAGGRLVPDRRARRHPVGRRAPGQRGQVPADLRAPAAQRPRARPARQPDRCCSPRAPATASPSTRRRSTPSGSPGSRASASAASPTAARRTPPRPSPRRWPCGADRRTPASTAPPSPWPRPAGWRSCGSRPPRTGSPPSSPSGSAAAAVPELERLVGEHPMRERLWEMLVTALYRAGRQGDALGAYERARAVLSDELGVDPGPGLRAVHARVLAHDPTLGLPDRAAAIPAAAAPRPHPRRARGGAGAAARGVAVGGARPPGHRRRPRPRGCRRHGPGRGPRRRGGPRGRRRRLPVVRLVPGAGESAP